MEGVLQDDQVNPGFSEAVELRKGPPLFYSAPFSHALTSSMRALILPCLAAIRWTPTI